VGIGLPSHLARLDGRVIPEWARRAEAAGFSTLGTIDRVALGGNHEPLASLAAAREASPQRRGREPQHDHRRAGGDRR
jgi:hypothetical protein